jgi:hypothetical protein
MRKAAITVRANRAVVKINRNEGTGDRYHVALSPPDDAPIGAVAYRPPAVSLVDVHVGAIGKRVCRWKRSRKPLGPESIKTTEKHYFGLGQGETG